MSGHTETSSGVGKVWTAGKEVAEVSYGIEAHIESAENASGKVTALRVDEAVLTEITGARLHDLLLNPDLTLHLEDGRRLEFSIVTRISGSRRARVIGKGQRGIYTP